MAKLKRNKLWLSVMQKVLKLFFVDYETRLDDAVSRDPKLIYKILPVKLDINVLWTVLKDVQEFLPAEFVQWVYSCQKFLSKGFWEGVWNYQKWSYRSKFYFFTRWGAVCRTGLGIGSLSWILRISNLSILFCKPAEFHSKSFFSFCRLILKISSMVISWIVLDFIQDIFAT